MAADESRLDGQLDPRIDRILEVLLAFARQDFRARAPVSEARDEVDALATGLNMLAEELDGTVASKRELEAAYEALKVAQAQRLHRSKLEAIGQLASGVAHEINNPAAWVAHSLSLMKRHVDAVASFVGVEAGAAPAASVVALRAALEDATQGLERIRVIAGDLRTFSRMDGDLRVPTSLRATVQSAYRLARPTLEVSADLEMDLEEVWVFGEPGRLAQVMTNLLLNATQALPPPPAPRGRVHAQTCSDGNMALLVVEDSGPGIPPELRERVFEPFFTTKPAEMGTGLGLALVAEIVRHHGGDVRVTSSRLGGARFEVRLPALRDRPAAPLAAPSAHGERGKARVLMVDDEPNLLRTYKLLLEHEQHDVEVEPGGAEAISRLGWDAAFDVVICDLMMPGVNGLDVYRHLHAHHPELLAKFVVASGGLFPPGSREQLQQARVPVLDKPIRVQALLELVARARTKRGL